MDIYQTPVLLKGYHQDHNPTRDYKTAKTPISTSTGFTKPDYLPPAPIQVRKWIAEGGWLGHLVPEGMHVIDVEDEVAISQIMSLCRQKGITPPVNVTDNGVHIVFKTNGDPPLPGADGRLTRLGFPVTDRSAGKNYVILPPTNGRRWENKDQLNDPPVIPYELLPAQDTIEDTTRVLAWSLGDSYRKGLLAGYDDLDAGFMALLISCDIAEAPILEAYRLAFLDSFDERRTLAMYLRTIERKTTEQPLRGVGSLVQSLKDKGLDAIVATITKLERLTGKTADAGADEKKKRESKTDKLIKMGLADFELFHDNDLKAYATIQREKHRETYSLRSKGFRTCLTGKFWSQYGEGIGGQILQDAIGTLEGHAIHEGSCCPVYVRLAAYNDTIYLNLGNDSYEVVEITSSGWSVLGNQNVIKFRRPPGMTALSYPKEGGDIEALKRYVNLADPDDWPLVIGFILGCFHPSGPYPVLAVTGEQGSAKSTLLRVTKAITDPSTAPLRSIPKEKRDLAISANNGWTLAFDNLSSIPEWFSDALCRLSTGGGFTTRTLCTDDDETIFDSKRPAMLNCIDNVIRHHDLADRSIIINLAPIPDEKRISESDFWGDFYDDAPEILGAILDAVCCSLKNKRTVRLSKVPRMADFAVWVTAAEPALNWSDGTFLKAYMVNRRELTSMTLDADQVGTAVKTFLEARLNEAWEGTASELLDVLDDRADERTQKGRDWPRSASALSGKMKRSATALREQGVEVTIGKDKQTRKRFIRIEQTGEKVVSIAPDGKNEGINQYIQGSIKRRPLLRRSSPDRPSRQIVDDDGDETRKNVARGADIMNSANSTSYTKGDDGDDRDDAAPPLFKSLSPKRLWGLGLVKGFKK